MDDARRMESRVESVEMGKNTARQTVDSKHYDSEAARKSRTQGRPRKIGGHGRFRIDHAYQGGKGLCICYIYALIFV